MYNMLVLLLLSSLSMCGCTKFTNLSTSNLKPEEQTPSDQYNLVSCEAYSVKLLAKDKFISGNFDLLCTLVLIMEQVNFNQSLKNIPVPDKRTYREDLIGAIEKVIKNMRWKALAFFKPFANKNKETFGLKSTNSPKTIDQMKAFEDDLVKMAQNIEFRKVDNAFQKNLSKICKELQNEPKLIIPADKTSNFYKISKDQYEELRIKDVQNVIEKKKCQVSTKSIGNIRKLRKN